jgi:putative transposase
MGRKSKFSSEQIAYAVRQAEPGVPIAEVCRKYGISQQTFYRWRQKYGGLTPSEVRRSSLARPSDRSAAKA